MRHSRGFFAKIGCGLKRFLLANSTVHPTELIHEGIEGRIFFFTRGPRIQQDLAKVEKPSGAERGRGKRVSFADTDVTSCEHLHLNSFSWIRDVWKRASNRLRRKFFFFRKQRNVSSSLLTRSLLLTFSIPKKNYLDIRCYLGRDTSYIHHISKYI